MAVSAVTDLWTRQAFVKAEQLQQQGGAVAVNQETAATSAGMGKKVVKSVTTLKRGKQQ